MAEYARKVSGIISVPCEEVDLFATDNNWKEVLIHLFDLADELLVTIAGFINPYVSDRALDDKPCNSSFARSLLNFGLASKRTFAICEPILYSYIQQHASKPLFPILRTILLRPDLARHVKALASSAVERDTSLSMSISQPSLDISFTRTPDWEPLIVDAIDNLRQGYQETFGKNNPLILTAISSAKWKDDIKLGSWDAAVSLMMLYLPNLQVVKLGEWSNVFQNNCPYIIGMMKRARVAQNRHYNMPLSLPNLDTLFLNFRAKEPRGFVLEQLFPILDVPSLKTISASKFFEDTLDAFDSTDYWLNHPPTFHTKHLALTKAWIQPEILKRFLACFPTLESFIYEHGNLPQRQWGDRGQGWNVSREMEAFEPPSFMMAIKSLQPTLRSLTVVNDMNDWNYSVLSVLPVGSLVDFTKLKYLKMGISILMGVDVDWYDSSKDLTVYLPQSLEHLVICSIKMEDVIRPIHQLLDSRVGRIHNLKTIKLEWADVKQMDSFPNVGYTPSTVGEEQASVLRAKSEDVGIKLLLPETES